MRVLIGGLLLAFSGVVAGQSLPAFYGAEGGGALSVGGRGGTVCIVDRLTPDDNNPGSLRYCVNQSGPRTVVFRVGGTITLTSRLNINNSHITIAGHTAPGGGIQIRGAFSYCGGLMRVDAQHVIIRYLTLRRGRCNEPGTSTNTGGGGIGFQGRDAIGYHIIDHLSSYWTTGVSFAWWGHPGEGPKNATVQNSIMAEGLRGRSMGAITGGNTEAQTLNMTDIDFHKNLFAHIGWRTPLLKNARSRIISNIVYNWWMYSTHLGGGMHADVINNLYKHPKPSDIRTRAEISVYVDDSTNCHWVPGIITRDPSIYAAGNQGPLYGTDNWNMVRQMSCEESRWDFGALKSQWRRSSPLAPVGVPITVIPTEQLESHIYPLVGDSRRLDCMGNWVSKRDSQDARIVNHAQTNHNPNFTPGRTTWGIFSENDVGGFPTIAGDTPCQDSDGDGMPDEWEIMMGLNPNDPSDRNTLHSSGYTMLEMYLNGPMGSQPPSPPPPDEELPRIVQTATGFVNDGNTFDLVFGTAPTEGNKLMFIGNISKFSDATRVATIPDFSSDAVLGNDFVSMVVLSKTAGAAEGATYTVSVSGTVQKHAGILYEIEGANNTSFFNALELTESLTSTAVVPTAVGVRPISALAIDLNQSLDPPSGWTNLITVLPINHPLYAVNRVVGTDTTTSYSATWGSGAHPVSATILINPADYEPPEPLKTIVPPSGLRYVR